MGKYEVTNGEFRKFVNSTGYETDAEKRGSAWGQIVKGTSWGWGGVDGLNWRNTRWKIDERQPVSCASWNDAQAYVRSLNNGRDTGPYRLPSEAEWEYACRAGTTAVFPWGYEANSGKGWLNAADYTKSPEGVGWIKHFDFSDGFFFPAPVGSFNANRWGLHDMIGNVWEWCADWYGEYSSASTADPRGAVSGSLRVVRGGSWFDIPGLCRSAERNWGASWYTNTNIGFRIVRTP